MRLNSRELTLLGVSAAILVAFASWTGWRLVQRSRDGWTGMMFFRPAARHGTGIQQGTIGLHYSPGSVARRPGEIYAVAPGGPAARAGFRETDLVVQIEGIPIEQSERLNVLLSSAKTGEVVTFRIRRDGREWNAPLMLSSPLAVLPIAISLLSAIAVSLAFPGIGLFVFIRKPGDRRTRLFYLLSVLAPMYFINQPVSQLEAGYLQGFGSPAAVSVGQGPLSAVLAAVFVPMLLHLALIFPRERPVMRSGSMLIWIYGPPICALLSVVLFILIVFGDAPALKILAPAVQLAAILLLIGVAYFLVRLGLRRGIHEHPWILLGAYLVIAAALVTGYRPLGGLQAVEIITMLFLLVPWLSFAVFPVATCVALFRSFRESGVEEKRQVSWPVWGTMVAIGGRLVLGLATTLLILFLATRGRFFPPIPVVLVRDLGPKLLYLLIPVSFAFAILKYRLMEIDLIVRKTIIYSILSAIVLLLYLALVGGIGTALVRTTGIENQTVVVAATLLIAALFVPLRNRVQGAVDRRLFREKYDYPVALERLSGEVRSLHDLGALSRFVLETVQKAVQPRWGLVFVGEARDRSLYPVAVLGIAEDRMQGLRIERGSPAAGGEAKVVRPREDELPVGLRPLGCAVLVRAYLEGEPAAIVALGKKVSGEDYEPHDIDFLAAVSQQLTIGIEHLRVRSDADAFAQAREIQASLIPSIIPQLDGCAITGFWQPATAVGGDYFDVIRFSPSAAAICIADVAGKGLPAALLMSNLQAAVRSIGTLDTSPKDLCSRVGGILAPNLGQRRFVTFFYAVLDLAKRSIVYTNAGHNPPVLVRQDGSMVRLTRGGPVFSPLFRRAAYIDDRAELMSGDRIVLFTDGASEVRNEADEEFGEPALESLIVRERELEPAALQERIVETVTRFCHGRLHDDLTLLVVAVG